MFCFIFVILYILFYICGETIFVYFEESYGFTTFVQKK